MSINDKTKELIISFEDKKYKVYLDSAGKPTVGIGHLIIESDNLAVGDTINEARLESLFIQDISEAESGVTKALGGMPTWLNSDQYGALVAFYFNTGAGISTAPTMWSRIHGTEVSLFSALMQWVHDTKIISGVKTKVVENGLIRRRAAECALWAGDYEVLDELISSKQPLFNNLISRYSSSGYQGAAEFLFNLFAPSPTKKIDPIDENKNTTNSPDTIVTDTLSQENLSIIKIVINFFKKIFNK